MNGDRGSVGNAGWRCSLCRKDSLCRMRKLWRGAMFGNGGVGWRGSIACVLFCSTRTQKQQKSAEAEKEEQELFIGEYRTAKENHSVVHVPVVGYLAGAHRGVPLSNNILRV